jgi:hypothetical protein
MDVDGQKKKQIPALGVLEEDDEFEEFPAQGMCSLCACPQIYSH